MNRAKIAIKGQLAGMPPLLKASKKGLPYCSFHISDDGVLYRITCFDVTARAVVDAKLETGAKVSVSGYYRDETDKANRVAVAEVVAFPGATGEVETTPTARLWGSASRRGDAWQKELEYQANFGRVPAYDADDRRWFWPLEDTVDVNGKLYIKLEAEIIKEMQNAAQTSVRDG